MRLWLGLHLALKVDVVPLLDEEVLLAAAAAAEGAQGRANLQGDAREVCKECFTGICNEPIFLPAAKPTSHRTVRVVVVVVVGGRGEQFDEQLLDV